MYMKSFRAVENSDIHSEGCSTKACPVSPIAEPPKRLSPPTATANCEQITPEKELDVSIHDTSSTLAHNKGANYYNRHTRVVPIPVFTGKSTGTATNPTTNTTPICYMHPPYSDIYYNSNKQSEGPIPTVSSPLLVGLPPLSPTSRSLCQGNITSNTADAFGDDQNSPDPDISSAIAAPLSGSYSRVGIDFHHVTSLCWDGSDSIINEYTSPIGRHHISTLNSPMSCETRIDEACSNSCEGRIKDCTNSCVKKKSQEGSPDPYSPSASSMGSKMMVHMSHNIDKNTNINIKYSGRNRLIYSSSSPNKPGSQGKFERELRIASLRTSSQSPFQCNNVDPDEIILDGEERTVTNVCILPPDNGDAFESKSVRLTSSISDTECAMNTTTNATDVCPTIVSASAVIIPLVRPQQVMNDAVHSASEMLFHTAATAEHMLDMAETMTQELLSYTMTVFSEHKRVEIPENAPRHNSQSVCKTTTNNSNKPLNVIDARQRPDDEFRFKKARSEEHEGNRSATIHFISTTDEDTRSTSFSSVIVSSASRSKSLKGDKLRSFSSMSGSASKRLSNLVGGLRASSSRGVGLHGRSRSDHQRPTAPVGDDGRSESHDTVADRVRRMGSIGRAGSLLDVESRGCSPSISLDTDVPLPRTPRRGDGELLTMNEMLMHTMAQRLREVTEKDEISTGKLNDYTTSPRRNVSLSMKTHAQGQVPLSPKPRKNITAINEKHLMTKSTAISGPLTSTPMNDAGVEANKVLLKHAMEVTHLLTVPSLVKERLLGTMERHFADRCNLAMADARLFRQEKLVALQDVRKWKTVAEKCKESSSELEKSLTACRAELEDALKITEESSRKNRMIDMLRDKVVSLSKSNRELKEQLGRQKSPPPERHSKEEEMSKTIEELHIELASLSREVARLTSLDECRIMPQDSLNNTRIEKGDINKNTQYTDTETIYTGGDTTGIVISPAYKARGLRQCDSEVVPFPKVTCESARGRSEDAKELEYLRLRMRPLEAEVMSARRREEALIAAAMKNTELNLVLQSVDRKEEGHRDDEDKWKDIPPAVMAVFDCLRGDNERLVSVIKVLQKVRTFNDKETSKFEMTFAEEKREKTSNEVISQFESSVPVEEKRASPIEWPDNIPEMHRPPALNSLNIIPRSDILDREREKTTLEYLADKDTPESVLGGLGRLNSRLVDIFDSCSSSSNGVMSPCQLERGENTCGNQHEYSAYTTQIATDVEHWPFKSNLKIRRDDDNKCSINKRDIIDVTLDLAKSRLSRLRDEYHN